MRTYPLKTLTLLILTCLGFAQAGATGFEFVKKSGTVHLYERWINGKDGESVRELKAIFMTNSSSQALIRLLKDDSRGSKWNERAAVYSILDGSSADTWINYIHYDLPAIMDDQDCCLKYQVHRDASGRVDIRFVETEHAAFPIKKNVSRITGVKGNWRLIPQSGDRLQVTYTITSDRNKSIPRFVSDPIIQNNLLKTMNTFKSLLEN